MTTTTTKATPSYRNDNDASTKPQPPSTDSTPSLSNFLAQISAGSASNALPIHAQASLIATQLSNVEDAAVKLLSDRKDDVLGTIDGAEEAQSRLLDLDTRVGQISQKVSPEGTDSVGIDESAPDLLATSLAQRLLTVQSQSLDTSTLLTSLQAYVDAYNTYHQKSLLLTTLTALQPLLQAVENLEHHVQSGSVDHKVLAEKMAAAGLLLAAFRPNGEHAWLRNGNAKALSDLEERLDEAKRQSEELLEGAWAQAVRLSKDAKTDAAVAWSISIDSQVHVGAPSSRTAALADLAESLEAKGKLKSKLESLATTLGECVGTSLLSADIPCVAFSIDSNTARVAGDLPGEERSPRSSLDHFTQLVDYLDTHLLQHLPSHTTAFSQRFVAATIPLLLSKLRQCLPSNWSRQAAELSLDLQGIAEVSRTLYKSLAESHFIPADLRADSPEDELLGFPSRLLDFARRLGEIYGKQMQNAVRDQARRLLLASVDGQNAWDTEEIEVEPTVVLPDEQDGGYEESAVEAMLGNSTQPHSGDGWGWGADGDDEEEEEDAPLQQKQRASSSSSPAPGKAKGKAALGGVRVIRPQDQFGSGPFPQTHEGSVDDDAWGFDDEEPHQEGRTSSPPPSSRALDAGVEADAWGFGDEDEESAEEAAVPQTAQGSQSAHPTAPKPAIAPPTEQQDEDDPWFQEQEDSAESHPAEQAPPPVNPSTSHIPPVPASTPTDDADAWFVDEQPEEGKDAVVHPSHDSDSDVQTSVPPFAPAVPVQSAGVQSESSLDALQTAPTTPPPKAMSVPASSANSTPSQVSDTSFSRTTRDFDLGYDDDDDDDDAWGLSEEEKTEKVLSKRASRMLGAPSTTQSGHSDGLQSSASAETISSLTPTPSQTDVTATANEDEDASLTPSSSLHLSSAVSTQAEASDATTPQLGTNVNTSVTGNDVDGDDDDDDDDDDAWGLSAQEQEARNKRRSQLFGAPPPQFPATADGQTSRDTAPLSDLSEEPSGDTASTRREQLTEKNLEAAAAAREQNHQGVNGETTTDPGASAHRPLLPPSIRLPPPSEVSSVSALPPSSPTSDKLSFGEQGESHLTPGSLAETSSVISEPSSDVAFPIESALPEDLQPSELASNASLPATPKSERAGGTLSSLNGSTTQSVADLIRQQEAETGIDDDADEEPADVRSIAESLPLSDDGAAAAREVFPLQSALPVSSTGLDTPNGTVSSLGGGPPSAASLPPTPKAERHIDLPASDELLGSSDGDGSVNGSQAAIPPSAPVSRPYTPDASVFSAQETGSDPPFPIHSAVPYSAGTGRTGPPSIAGSVADSDAALPPSPYPERISTPWTDDGEGVDGLFNSDDYAAADEGEVVPGRATPETRDRSATATLSSVNAENLRRLSATPQPPDVASHVDEQERLHGGSAAAAATALAAAAAVEDESTTDATAAENDDDDDPWDDFEAQPKEVNPQQVLPIQPAVEGVDTIAAKRTADTLQSTVGSGEVQASTADIQTSTEHDDDDDDENDDGWQWGDEEGEEAAASQKPIPQSSAPASSPTPPTPPIIAKRALSPLSGPRRAASPSGASPQLRKATLRAATAAAAAAGVTGTAAATTAAVGTVGEVADGRDAHPASSQRDVKSTPTAAPAPVLRRMEKCKISKRSRELVNLANRVIDDALQLAKGKGEGDTNILPSSGNLLKSIVEIFELHRALMPALHRDVFLNVPSLSAQFANDCQFLAKEMLVVAQRVEDSGISSTDVPTHLRAEAQRTTLLGKGIFEEQLTVQASLLNEHLVQTDSLLRVYEDARYENVQRIHTQVVHLISSLYSAWRSVLTESAVNASVGTLIEATLQRVWKWVLDLDDIGEIEGQRLAELVKVFHKLEELYDTSTIALFVPSWIKVTGYLPEILLGSLADVEFLLFEAGGLDVHGEAAVRKEEARRLIRSTFADTARRRELLARVERA